MTGVQTCALPIYFGSNMPTVLFPSHDNRWIKWAINTYEPRADIDFVEVVVDRENNMISANIQFYILNQEQPVEVTLSLGRVR